MQAQEYTISNAYPSIVKATGEQRSFTAHGNTLLVWRLFFEGVEGYYQTNRKSDNAPTKGDVVYGVLGQDQFGNGTFKSESRPMGQLPTAKPTVHAAPVSSELSEKVDYLISMVEQLLQNNSGYDGGPVDLSEIPFK